jgi:hypothetical protein
MAAREVTATPPTARPSALGDRGAARSLSWNSALQDEDEQDASCFHGLSGLYYLDRLANETVSVWLLTASGSGA